MRETHSSTQNASSCRIASALKRGIDPRWSGFRVQGSATSPAGMALFHNLLSYYNKTSGVLQGLFKIFAALRCGFQADATLWVDIPSIFRRGGVSPPVCRKFYLTSRRRTSEPALCKGRCRVKRGGGVVPDTNQLLCSANFMLLQSLRRSRASSLYWGEPCGRIALHAGGATPPLQLFVFAQCGRI